MESIRLENSSSETHLKPSAHLRIALILMVLFDLYADRLSSFAAVGLRSAMRS